MEAMEKTGRRRRVRFLRSGLTARQERVFDGVSRALVIAMVAAWTASVMQAYEPAASSDGVSAAAPPPVRPLREVGSSLLDPRSRTAPYLSDQLLGPLRRAEHPVHPHVDVRAGQPLARRRQRAARFGLG